MLFIYFKIKKDLFIWCLLYPVICIRVIFQLILCMAAIRSNMTIWPCINLVSLKSLLLFIHSLSSFVPSFLLPFLPYLIPPFLSPSFPHSFLPSYNPSSLPSLLPTFDLPISTQSPNLSFTLFLLFCSLYSSNGF